MIPQKEDECSGILKTLLENLWLASLYYFKIIKSRLKK